MKNFIANNGDWITFAVMGIFCLITFFIGESGYFAIAFAVVALAALARVFYTRVHAKNMNDHGVLPADVGGSEPPVAPEGVPETPPTDQR